MINILLNYNRILPKSPNIVSIPNNNIIIKNKIAQILLKGIIFIAMGNTIKHKSDPYNSIFYISIFNSRAKNPIY